MDRFLKQTPPPDHRTSCSLPLLLLGITAYFFSLGISLALAAEEDQAAKLKKDVEGNKSKPQRSATPSTHLPSSAEAGSSDASQDPGLGASQTNDTAQSSSRESSSRVGTEDAGAGGSQTKSKAQSYSRESGSSVEPQDPGAGGSQTKSTAQNSSRESGSSVGPQVLPSGAPNVAHDPKTLPAVLRPQTFNEKPRRWLDIILPSGFDWLGSLEIDLGHAAYSFDTAAYPKERFFDFRGRFVFGPIFEYKLNQNYFLRAKAQLVAWVRETYGVYQVNVDDVWAQIGQGDLWDFQLGRFMTWTLYNKGLGFDLYTLDDTGALETPPYESGQFGPDIYEINYIYLRETPGRAAFHFFPTKWSGIEIAGAYGKDGTSNTAGVRTGLLFDFKMLRLTAGGEYRFLEPAQETTAPGPDGNIIRCEKCGFIQRWGFGGGAIFSWKFIEAGLNAARAEQSSYAIKDGTYDKNSSFNTVSLGGYLQIDPGSLVLRRQLIFGLGINRTEVLYENDDFKRHVQWAAYVALPFGQKGAMLKFVFSRADVLTEDNTGDNLNFIERNGRMLAGRLRLFLPF